MSSHHSMWKSLGRHWLPQSVLIALLITSSLILCSCGEKKEAEPAAATLPPVKVKVEIVRPEQVSKEESLIGRLDSRNAVALYPKIDGSVTRISVNPGDVVKAGQLILEVDSLKQQAAVATKESDVAGAKADHEKEVARLKALKAERDAQVAQVSYAQHEFERNYWLEQRGVVSESTVDGFDRQLKVAKAKLAENDANIVAQKEVIERSAKAILAAKSNEKEQEEQLAFYRVKAPFAGIVADVPVKLGDYVDSSTKLTTISQLRPLEVNVLVPKVMAMGLRIGMPLELLDDAGKPVAQCKVFHIDPIVDQQNQSVLVKALFDNAQGNFRPDQSVATRLTMTQHQGISVPTESLSFVAGKAFAYVVAANPAGGQPLAQQRVLKVASLEGNRAVIDSGITAGEKVVVSGVQSLRDGSPLIIE